MKQQKVYQAAAAVSAMVVSAALLTGCSTETSSSDAAALTFAYPAAGNAKVWETMAERYTAASGVKVEVEPIAIDAYDSALNTRLQGGNAPDLFLTKPGTNGIGIVALGKAGKLGEVSGAAASLIKETERDAYAVEGKTYGFPLYNAPRSAVVFNENLTKSGETWPETIDGMLAQCKNLRQQGIAFTLGQYGTPFTADGQTLLTAASSVYAHDPDWDQKRAKGQVTFSNTMGWRYALQTMVDMYHGGCYQQGAEAAGGEFWTGVNAGKTPSILSLSTGEADIWKDLSNVLPNETFSVDAFPGQTAEDRRVVNSVKFTLSSNAAAKNQKAIQAYIDWLAQPENLKEIADLTGGVPAGDLTVASLPAAYKPLAPFIETGKVISQPGLFWPSKVLTTMQEEVPGLLTGQKTIDQVLGDMDAAWTQ